MTNPRIVNVKNAQIFPFSKPVRRIDHSPKWTHGVDTREDIATDLCDQYRFGRSVINRDMRTVISREADAKTLNGRWFYGGLLYNHFGHFLAESVHRLWAWRDFSDNCEGILFLPVGKPKVDMFGSHVKDFLDFAGIPQDRITLVKDLRIVDQLIIAESGSQLGVQQPSWYQQKVSSMLNLNGFPDSNSPQRLFMSRRKFMESGKIIGLTAVERFLEQYGFVTVFPEQHTLEQQIRFLKNATDVVWEEGSNIHLLDCLPRLKLNAHLFKRRANGKTFGPILKSKCESYTSFNNVKRLIDVKHCQPDGYSNISKPLIQNRTRFSLCVVQDIVELCQFVARIIGKPTLSSSQAGVLERSLLEQEYVDIREYLDLLEVESNSEIAKTLFNEYTAMRNKKDILSANYS